VRAGEGPSPGGRGGLRRPSGQARRPRYPPPAVGRFGTTDPKIMTPATSMGVRHAQTDDRDEWARVRAALVPEPSAESHAEEIAAFLTGTLTGWLRGLQAVAVFVAVRPGGGLCGFLEASVRPLADGCSTYPVGYVEGWYVDPDVRQQGVGKTMLK